MTNNSIKIGPVLGMSGSDSANYIYQQIIAKFMQEVPEGAQLLLKYGDLPEKNLSTGTYIIPIIWQKVEDIDDLFIPLAKFVQEIAAKKEKTISCGKIDKGFNLGEDEGGVPDEPVVGPRGSGPALFEHESIPETGGFLNAPNIAVRAGDEWQQDLIERRGAAERAK